MSGRREATLQKREPAAPEAPKTLAERAKCLSKEEFSRKLLSYVVSGMLAALFGFFMIVPFSSTVIPLSESARNDGFVIDVLFIMLIPVLSINVFSRSYMLIHRDPFHGWLLFQRSLPVLPKEIVLARSFVMLPATAVMVTLFFTPLVLLSQRLDSQFDGGQYFWFVLIWLGYALLFGGINLFMELGLNGKLVFALQFLSLGPMISIAWLLDGELVFTTFKLAGSHGPLLAGISLLAGGLLFALLAKATENRVGNRELSQ